MKKSILYETIVNLGGRVSLIENHLIFWNILFFIAQAILFINGEMWKLSNGDQLTPSMIVILVLQAVALMICLSIEMDRHSGEPVNILWINAIPMLCFAIVIGAFSAVIDILKWPFYGLASSITHFNKWINTIGKR